MLTFICVVLVLVALCLCYVWWIMRQAIYMDHIPGPKGHFLCGTESLIDSNQRDLHQTVTQLSKEYGPVYKLQSPTANMVIVCSYEGIHEFCIRKVNDTSGRTQTPCGLTYTHSKTGIMSEPDAKRNTLHKRSHQYLKLLGENDHEMENVTSDVTEHLLENFRKHEGIPMDPKSAIADAAFKVMAFLVTGEQHQTGDRLLQQLYNAEQLLMKHSVSVTNHSFSAVDILIWLRFVIQDYWSKSEKVKVQADIGRNILQCLERGSGCECLAKSLLLGVTDHVVHDTKSIILPNEVILSEYDVLTTCINVIINGATTTRNTFHALINILAHNGSVQTAIFEEIAACVPRGSTVTLIDRRNMSYTSAMVLEVLRYFPVAPLGAPHTTTADSYIQGYLIPKDTDVFTNI